MDLLSVITELRREREKLVQIIQSLEQLNRSSTPFAREPAGTRPGRKFMDSKARMDVSRRMKKYWEARRNGNPNTAAVTSD